MVYIVSASNEHFFVADNLTKRRSIRVAHLVGVVFSLLYYHGQGPTCQSNIRITGRISRCLLYIEVHCMVVQQVLSDM